MKMCWASLVICEIQIKRTMREHWEARLEKCLTLDFGSGRDLRVVRLSPVLGSTISEESA